MNVQKFLKKKHVETVDDIRLQVESWAYIIAKHFGISLLEVYSMPQDLFKQSLVWALAINEEEEKERKRSEQQAKSGGNETVSLDYSFLDTEDFG